jgi:cellulose synthase/poly-beta-1,6-N-acetylglucosamine synthase-like glycosyltransferase/putative flippase GtrA
MEISRSWRGLRRARGFRFGLVGLSGVLVNSAALWVLAVILGLPTLLASLLATETAILTNFLLNDRWTFRSQGYSHRLGRRLLRYHGVAASGAVITVGLLALLTARTTLPLLAANLLAIGVATIWTYSVSSRWAWAQPVVAAPRSQRAILLRRCLGFALGVAAALGTAVLAVWLTGGWLPGLVLVASLALFAQSLFSLFMMLYTWERPERLEASAGPRSFLPPQHSFTVLLPARHEEAVIFRTIQSVWAANYPKELLEVVVICHADDTGTIAEVRRAIAAIGSPRVRLETFEGAPINKPRGLNVGLARTRNAVVTVFDAEDDIDPEIFNSVNTVMLSEEAGVVQGGVQLMNFRDHWFGVHNCLEYFFWFKSRLQFHAAVGMIPLGGNTVFIRRELLQRLGGWDQECLTEDAEIGIRLSALGERIRVIYDAQRVTREETPATVAQFVKQRTRWCQGFLQVLRKGDWLRLPRLGQRLLALYTLSYPLLQAILLLLWPAMLLMALWVRLPLAVTMVAFLPLYVLLLQFVLTAIGAWLFTREYGLRLPPLMPAAMALTFLPYQWLLGLSAVRAVARELRRENSWEKTAHTGAHREPERARELGR